MFSLIESRISSVLAEAREPSDELLAGILKKAGQKKGLELEEAAALLQIKSTNKKQMARLLASAGKVKNEIYGNRIVLFAPLYLSDFCVNDCKYCGFHCSNKTLNRKRLTTEEIAEQTRIIIGMGHKRILLEVGEHPDAGIDYICSAIRTVYGTKNKNGEIRRVNVNIAATTTENYRKLKEVGIGTYQLFQETYHKQTYKTLHSGPKADYERQLHAHERAFEAGIDDYGMGVLFGLYDYTFEVLGLLSHAQYMEQNYGVGPHTISVPRFRPADSVVVSPRFPVLDGDFLKLIAVLRLAVPYTGMILSTRETPEMRAKTFQIGISQISAASRAAVGGYTSTEYGQFSLADHRSVEEVVADISKYGLLPSFCTACYRSNRTGDRFMELAKTGNIHHLCRPNAILTFKEYLMDYASEETRNLGNKLVEREIGKIENQDRRHGTQDRLKRIEQGERDLFF